MSFEEKVKAYFDSLPDDEKEKLYKIHSFFIEHGIIVPVLGVAMNF